MAAKSKVDAQGNYRCPKCLIYKPVSEFYLAYGDQRGKKSPYCKPCKIELDFIRLQKRRLEKIGVEAYQKDLKREQDQLKIKYQLVVDYLTHKEGL